MAKDAKSKHRNFGVGRRGAESKRGRAEEYAKDPERVKQLLTDALKKAEDRKGALTELWDSLMTLMRLVGAWINGKYKAIPWKSGVLALAAILYFVSPIDFVPDWIPVAGFLDDAAVIAFVVHSMRKDLDAFAKWETGQAT